MNGGGVYAVGPARFVEGYETGAFGFDVATDRRIALALREHNLRPEEYSRLNEEGRQIIREYGIGEPLRVGPYFFVDGSLLLCGIQVLPASCRLALGNGLRDLFLGKKFRQEKELIASIRASTELLPVVYIPHRIETPEQAQCMTSLVNLLRTEAEKVLGAVA